MGINLDDEITSLLKLKELMRSSLQGFDAILWKKIVSTTKELSLAECMQLIKLLQINFFDETHPLEENFILHLQHNISSAFFGPEYQAHIFFIIHVLIPAIKNQVIPFHDTFWLSLLSWLRQRERKELISKLLEILDEQFDLFEEIPLRETSSQHVSISSSQALLSYSKESEVLQEEIFCFFINHFNKIVNLLAYADYLALFNVKIGLTLLSCIKNKDIFKKFILSVPDVIRLSWLKSMGTERMLSFLQNAADIRQIFNAFHDPHHQLMFMAFVGFENFLGYIHDDRFMHQLLNAEDKQYQQACILNIFLYNVPLKLFIAQIPKKPDEFYSNRIQSVKKIYQQAQNLKNIIKNTLKGDASFATKLSLLFSSPALLPRQTFRLWSREQPLLKCASTIAMALSQNSSWDSEACHDFIREQISTDDISIPKYSALDGLLLLIFNDCCMPVLLLCDTHSHFSSSAVSAQPW